MNLEKIQKSFFWAIIASETTHVFCCGLPTLFSVLSLLAGLGVMTAIPTPLVFLHEILHEYERPMIIFAGCILAVGWILDMISARLDCQTTGCHHPPCKPVKRKAHIVLKLATLLFIFNLIVYFGFHAR